MCRTMSSISICAMCCRHLSGTPVSDGFINRGPLPVEAPTAVAVSGGCFQCKIGVIKLPGMKFHESHLIKLHNRFFDAISQSLAVHIIMEVDMSRWENPKHCWILESFSFTREGHLAVNDDLM